MFYWKVDTPSVAEVLDATFEATPCTYDETGPWLMQGAPYQVLSGKTRLFKTAFVNKPLGKSTI